MAGEAHFYSFELKSKVGFDVNVLTMRGESQLSVAANITDHTNLHGGITFTWIAGQDSFGNPSYQQISVPEDDPEMAIGKYLIAVEGLAPETIY
jgi:hypothetical protein